MLILHGEHTPPPGIDPVQKLREFPQSLRPEHQIHVAIALAHLLRHLRTLGHASAQADDLLRVLLFRVGQRPQIAVDPLFGVIPDGAGVQHHDVRLSGVVGELAAHVPQHSQNVLAVGHILLAAEGVHQRIDGLAPLLMEGRQLASILPLPLQLRFVQKNCFSIQWVPPRPGGMPGHYLPYLSR